MTPALRTAKWARGKQEGAQAGTGIVCYSTGCGPANQQHEWAVDVTGLRSPVRGMGHLAT